MNTATVITLAMSLVAAWTSGLNFSTYAQRREEQGHLWLGVAGVGVVFMGAATALLYTSTNVDTAITVRLVLGAASIPFFLGFLRFSEIFLGRSLRHAERIAGPAILLTMVLAMIPGLAYHGIPIQRILVGFDHRYVDASGTWLNFVFSAGYLYLAGYLIWQHLRALPKPLAEKAPILVAVALFGCAILNDLGVGLQLLHSPFLLIVGYVGLLTGFTAVLSRRFVLSAAHVEESAERLQRAAVERTEALRETDLQLANGEALATVGTLAAGLAHEINNPIAFVTANLNHLESLRAEPDGEAELLEILEETQEGVERIGSIVDELMRLAKRQEGGVEEVDLKSVVESVLPIARHEADGRALLKMHLEPVPVVLGDRRLLGQIVVNLVLNAIHSIPEENWPGEVVIATTVSHPVVKLHVRDTGSGIPEEVLPRIFEPFYTTKGSGEGTGLGLAITHQLVTRHRGRIDIDTSPAGTSMTIELPMVGSPSLAAESDEDAAPIEVPGSSAQSIGSAGS